LSAKPGDPELERKDDHFFELIRCGDWDELASHLEKLETGWLFRGARNAGWSLETSLERHAPKDRKRSEAEHVIVDEFTSRAHLHLQAQHVPTNRLEWVALIQHWGGPTRLLDVTASPYVAAYFAAEDATDPDGEFAIWAVDKTAVLLRAGEVLIDYGEHTSGKKVPETQRRAVALLMARLAEMESEIFDQFFWPNKLSLVQVVRPKRLSERLSLQQGLFLCPGDVDRTFMENLEATKMQPGSVKKLVLSHRHRGRTLERLRAMNITRATLFPGLEGLAQSLRQLLIEEPPAEKKARQELRYLFDGLRWASVARGLEESDRTPD
jgi:hypothetical protein